MLGAWCGWVSGFHRGTAPARITWGISLAAIVAVDLLLWRGRRGLRPGVRLEPVAFGWPPTGARHTTVLAGVAPWVTLALVVLVWDVLGLVTGRHTAHLTISALTETFRTLNAAMLLVWVSVGIGYGVMRARSPAGPAPTSPVSGSRGRLFSPLPLIGAPGLVLTAPVAGLLLPNNRAAGVAFWLGVVGAALVIEVMARRSGGRVANAEQFLRLVTTPRAANAFAVVAWTYAGYHLFAH